jgi:hypothetical protein
LEATSNQMGYCHPLYAFSLQEFGQPKELSFCGGWMLERQISGTPYKDAIGCYPLFACGDWLQISHDLEDMRTDLVSVALVADPFGNYDEALLRRNFEDVVIPFKQHFIIDLSKPLSKFASKHHIRYAKKALSQLHIEKCENPAQLIDCWVSLYNNLINRHQINGISAFSKTSFLKQLSVPGINVFRAIYEDKTVGMILWYTRNDVGYYHLAAYNSDGYDHRASFALFWFVIEYFADMGLKWLNLGGGAGIANDGTDGLSMFKRGWSTGTRTTYFCGRILNREKYTEITKFRGTVDTDFFPAYRKGEFG